MLDKRGEYYPYGAAVTIDGQSELTAGDPDEGEHPASVDVLNTLLAGFRAKRDQLRAIALVADVRVGDSDAVRVELEHRDGHAIAVLLPYKKKRFGRGIEYGQLQAGSATHQVWPDA
jgi:hypothetical protein